MVLMNSQGMQLSRGRDEDVSCRCVGDGRECKREQWWGLGTLVCMRNVSNTCALRLRQV